MKHFLLAISAIIATFFFTSFTTNIEEKLTVDVNSSTVKWTGYHIAKSYEHWGNVKIESGSIVVEGDDIVGGEILIDMTSITNGDLTDSKDNGKLVKDLKSDRFFGVSKFPSASLKIKNAERSGSNYAITADITIRDISQEIKFDAVKSNSNGKTTFTTAFSIDRTKHEVMYGWSVENVVLSNVFKLDINLVI